VAGRAAVGGGAPSGAWAVTGWPAGTICRPISPTSRTSYTVIGESSVTRTPFTLVPLRLARSVTST